MAATTMTTKRVTPAATTAAADLIAEFSLRRKAPPEPTVPGGAAYVLDIYSALAASFLR